MTQSLINLPSPRNDIERFQIEAAQALATLPADVLSGIARLRFDPSAPGALLLGNLARDPRLPLTPHDGMPSLRKRTFVSEACLLGVGRQLGEPYCYDSEKDATLVHDVVPQEKSLSSLSNAGSRRDLGAHIEVAYDSFRPHFILLYCLRADHERRAVTTAADVRDACRLLNREEIEVLRRPSFVIRVPESFLPGLGRLEWSAPLPVLSGPAGTPEACLNFNAMRALTDDAHRALESLRRALDAPGVLKEVRLTPGDLLIIDNRKTVHGRRPFEARFDGYDRWLQRIYVRTDLWAGRAHLKTPPRTFSLTRIESSAVRGNVISVGD